MATLKHISNSNWYPRLSERIIIVLTSVLILFWLFAAGAKLYDLNAWESEMNNQIFSAKMSNLLVFLVPATEIIIAALLVWRVTRLVGMALGLLLMLAFTAYVGLALLEIYSRMPCNCAGLLGGNSSWVANFMLNLFVTAVAITGFIFTFKARRKEEKGMDSIVLHAPLTA